MLGSALALLTRSLRVDARMLRVHLIRLFFVGLIFLSMSFALMTAMIAGAPGLQFFQSITYLTVVFITLAGISFFATAITEEKDEATLGLLKMAGMSPVSLLLGKSTTRVISVSLILAVQFPFTLLSITLGGITLGQVLSVYVALLAYMVLVANLGLFCSVYCSTSGKSASLTAVLLLGYLIAPSLVLSELQANSAVSTTAALAAKICEGLIESSVFGRFSVILQTGFSESAFSFQVGSNLIAAALFFVVSWLTFDLFTRDRNKLSTLGKLLSRSHGISWRRNAGRTWRYPLIWKDFHFITGGRKLMIGKTIIYGILVGILGYYIAFESGYVRNPRQQFGIATMSSMLCAMALELSIYASRVFQTEVKGKTLPNLIMLPISTTRLAYSKVAGCCIALVPAIIWLAIGAIIAPKVFFEGVWYCVSMPAIWYGFVQFVLFLHVTAFLSLVVKWGALPLSLAIVYFGQTCVMMPFLMILGLLSSMIGNEQLMFVPLAGVGVVLSFLLQVFIRTRIDILAQK